LSVAKTSNIKRKEAKGSERVDSKYELLSRTIDPYIYSNSSVH